MNNMIISETIFLRDISFKTFLLHDLVEDFSICFHFRFNLYRAPVCLILVKTFLKNGNNGDPLRNPIDSIFLLEDFHSTLRVYC